ncbi:MAG: hypothetical protein AMJ60_08955 [Desulfobacterales bacterium SG8_35]|nr:MAG: hypothetical protein AMJ60_08955 [Desulfobacterales bacterium SG8_35]
MATNTGITVAEGSTGSVILNTMLNEGDPDDSGTGLTYTVTTVPVNGTLKLSGVTLANNDTFTQDDIDNSRITYDHDSSETTGDSFVFTLADGGEDGAAALTGQTFAITVTPVNDPPFLATNTGVTVAEGSTGTVLSNSMLNAGDPDDSGTGLTYTVTTVPANGVLNLSGTALVNGDTFTQDDIDNSRITYDHDSSETTGDSFVFTLADGGENGAAALTAQTFAITVTPVNDPPTTSGLANVRVNENAPDSIINLSGAFADAEDATLTYTVTANTNSSLVTTAVAGSSLTLHYAADQFGTANITVRATDSGTLFVENTFRVTVTEVNNPPTTIGLADVTVDENAPDTVIDLSRSFSDIEDKILTYTVTANTNKILVTTSVAGSSLTLDYAADQFGTADITVRATDSDHLFVEDTFKVIVNPVNDAPTTIGLPDVTVNEDAPNTVIDLSRFFTDPDAAAVSADARDAKLTYTVTANTDSGLVTTSVAGSSLTLGYVADQNGPADITVRATDSGGLFVEDTFKVIVNPVNDAPTTTGLANVTVNENAPDSVINLSNAFADIDDTTLTYSVTANTDSGLVNTSVAGSSLTLHYAADRFGTADITVRAMDSGTLFVEDTFRVTVTEVNNTPTTTGLADVTVDENAPDTVIDLSGAFSDVEDETLTYSVTTNTDSGLVTVSVDGSSLTLDYVADQFGTADITVRATDSGGLFVEDTFRLTVAETRINPDEINNEKPETTPDRETDNTTAEDTDNTSDEDSTEPESEVDAEDTDTIADETLDPQAEEDFSEADGGQEQTEATSPVQLGLNPVGVTFRPVEIASLNLDLYSENQDSGQIAGHSMLGGSSPSQKNYYRREIDWGVDYKMTSLLLQHSFDALEKETAREIKLEKTVIGSAIAATTTFSVGYVVWVIRSGMLLSSLLSSLPAWQIADPLPILAKLKDSEDKDDESIEEIIGDDDTEQETDKRDDNEKGKPDGSE